MKKMILISTFTLVALLAATSVAFAAYSEDEGRAFGFRIGYGTEPDQFVIGLQADLGNAYGRLHFVPSLDLGFGDDMTTGSLNGDFKIFVPLPKSSVLFYGLAGPTFTHWMMEEVDDDSEIGFSLGVGARVELGDSGWYNLETRFGVGDIPEFRILAGLLFGKR